MAQYPSAIKTFDDQQDNVDDANAVDVNVVYDEIEAIETELGTLPKGSKADVKTRLAVALNDDGTLKSGSARQISKAEISAAITTVNTAYEDMTGLSVAMTTGANKAKIDFTGRFKISAVAKMLYIKLKIDATEYAVTERIEKSGYADGYFTMGFNYLTAALTAAAHTFKVIWKVEGGTGTCDAGVLIVDEVKA